MSAGGKLGFLFIPIPVAIYGRKDLLLVDKMIIGRILSFGAASCFLSQQTFADELGVTRIYVNERLKSLTQKGIIEAKRGRYGKSYRVVADVNYRLHLESEPTEQDFPDVNCSQHEMSTSDEMRCSPQTTQVDVLDNLLEEQSSSALVLSGTGDDERPSSERKPEDLEALVSVTQDQLQVARAAGLGFLGGSLVQVQRPDRAITIKILSVFSEHADYEVWLKGTIHRGVARKAKDARWGLYLADAQNQAENVARQRLAEEKLADFYRRAAEERAEKERARANFLATFLDPVAAIAAVEGARVRVAEILKKRLQRLGTPISPDGVAAAARAYRECRVCSRGLVGSAFDRTRRFCDCMAGEELAAEDPERPAREIESAHANLKNKLVAAAQTVNVYLGDAIEASEVTETPSEVVFDTPKSYRMHFSDPKFADVLKVAGEHRTVQFKWKAAA